MAYRAFLIGLLSLAAPAALAFDISTLSNSHGVDNFILLASVLLAATIGLAFWSSATNGSLRRIARGPRADNLYLSCKISVGDKEFTGHLRSIDNRSATIVAGESLVKGDKLTFSFSSLPGFPAEADSTQATIRHSHTVRGNPPSYILTMQWDGLSSSVSDDLERYIDQLSGNSRLSPAS